VARLRAARGGARRSASPSADDPGEGGEEEEDPEDLFDEGEDEEPGASAGADQDADAARAEDQARSDVKGRVDLHKHWQILHWYLTGEAEGGAGPGGDAILGGEPFGEDLGYGPVLALTPERVQAVAALLAKLGPAGVIARPGPPPADLYGAEFWEEGEDDFREEALHYAERLCAFYEEAARHQRAVVAWLS
jgi:hypothetical protein